MRIVRLTASNIKRLRAVEITPTGDIVTITGRNAQGKTSVLDAIWLALGGGAAGRETTRPVRDGEDHAAVTLDLGDLVVTRTWAGDKTSLTVKSADGAKYPSPQGVLDALVGRLSFDPLEFTRLSAREQTAALLDLVDLGDVDLEELARRRQGAYDTRTEVGRDLRALDGQIVGLGPVEEDAPDVEVSAADLATALQAGIAARHHAEDTLQRLTNAAATVDRLERDLVRARLDVTEAQGMVDALPEPVDLDELDRQIRAADDTNRAVRRNAERAAVLTRRRHVADEHDRLTATIEAIDARKATALAGATFPVDGLGFGDGGVTFGGVPFSQASSAEQIRVSLAMAMALSPKLRVIRILDGSLLDADNLALISEMASAQDYQVWLEAVGDGSNNSSAVVIEDGSVKS
jgi:hypothetical protein